MKKIKAFTIIELCVVMLLSSIVTGMVFFTLNIFQGSVRQFKTESTVLSRIALLHRLLVQDFWKSKEVRATNDGIQAMGKGGVVTYRFQPEYITREMGVVLDTFYFPNKNFVMQFQGQQKSLLGELVDQLSVDLSYKGEVVPFSFQKAYGADVLVLYDKKNLVP
jgi:hypothetical protein